MTGDIVLVTEEDLLSSDVDTVATRTFLITDSAAVSKDIVLLGYTAAELIRIAEIIAEVTVDDLYGLDGQDKFALLETRGGAVVGMLSQRDGAIVFEPVAFSSSLGQMMHLLAGG